MDFYTANWYPLGKAYYRKFDLYRMEWHLREDFKDCLVAAGPYGGPIALMRNYMTKEKSSSSRPALEIYSASGVLLSTMSWKSGQVVHLGWTVTEDLLCIQEDGTVLIYDIFCVFKRHFSMGSEIKQNQVLEAKVFHTEYGSGIAILTGALKFTLTSNIEELKLRRMQDIPGPKSRPTSWTVLFQDRITSVLLAMGKDLYLLDSTTCTPLTLPGMDPSAGACLQMSVSFNYKYLAVFTDTGYIWMGTSSLKDKLCDFASNMRLAPRQMAW
ncbi:vacuolar protein sorting-associated protein 16 homolog [Discoglossus pictus]